MNDVLKDQIAGQVDAAIALQGEDIDGAAARETCLQMLDQEEWKEWPATNKKGEQSSYIGRLAAAVLGALNQEVPEPTLDTVPDQGKWDASGEGPDPITKGRIIG